MVPCVEIAAGLIKHNGVTLAAIITETPELEWLLPVIAYRDNEVKICIEEGFIYMNGFKCVVV